MSDEKVTYVCTAGVDHTKGRNERGDVYTGPAKSVEWLHEQGVLVVQGSDEHDALKAQLAAEAEA